MRLALTNAVVKAIEAPETGRLAIIDTKQPGLVLRVTPRGVKSWCLYKRVDGKPQRTSLGTFPAIGVEDARRLAAMQTANIYAGRNPNAEKRSKRNSMTLGDAFEHFLDRSKTRGSTTTTVSH